MVDRSATPSTVICTAKMVASMIAVTAAHDRQGSREAALAGHDSGECEQGERDEECVEELTDVNFRPVGGVRVLLEGFQGVVRVGMRGVEEVHRHLDGDAGEA